MATKIKFLTRDDFFNIDECDCGKPVFRYHNTSKNMFMLKCSYVNEEFDLKTKKWVMSKKTPCKLLCAFSGERPVHVEIKKIIEAKILTKITTLEEQLKLLFSFLHISNRSSTLDEINLLVQHKLRRFPRKVFYFPTTTAFMKESHRETFKEYESRIFSEKIIDRSYKVVVKPIKPPSNSNFINVLEEESDNESNESNDESEKDADSNRDESDYSETSSVAEVEEEEEIFDEIEDYDNDDSNDESGY